MEEIQSVEIRHLRIDDYNELKASMIDAYSHWQGAYWKESHLKKLLEIFPDGQIAVLVNGVVVGSALSLIIKYDHFGDEHTYQEITGNYTFSTHNPKGDVLYGIEVFIKPEYRGLRLGRRLYDARKELCEKLNLKSIVFGGRIPGYHKYAGEITPKEYIQKVKLKEIYDPTLTFQLSNDFHVKKVLTEYMPGDEESKDYAVLLAWDNIYYTKKSLKLTSQKSIVRLGLIQWQMRQYQSVDELFEQVEYFIDAVSGYKSDFALFPEFFNAPLMAKYNHLSEAEAIRMLAEYTEEMRERFIQLAIGYNVNIITGSMPYVVDDKLYNIGYIIRRNGTYDYYEKIHVTPDETKYWGVNGGDKIEVFETDCGKIGVLICYDVEFPELSRILAKEEMKILFVPFLTDTQNGYSRVRNCAQARAIENECYVAIAGAVGNLPKVHNMDIQYAQSMVFTPCDFAFPTNGIKAEATPNTEMILVVDVDMDLLTELNRYGSVRNMRDRRTDLYELRLKQ
ncbi:MAG: bifunctional GNAT family N-acetyltransferase/carbon-nitrogen hydrolase family protein [Bacteroidales bacterium]|jgi:predicted amidohydrolase|nr:bifunctional GNAT family N-acetyltransferase/carbon-nitrogen hydrolase family protein [Bacteroidales bacterium]